MNKTRIMIMNRFRRSNGADMKKYRRLKRYWRLLLKSENALNHTTYKFYRMFGERLEVSIVKEMLNYDNELKVNYDDYYKQYKTRHYQVLKSVLNIVRSPLLSRYMKQDKIGKQKTTNS